MTADANNRENRLDDVIASYLQAVEAGTAPERATLLERHPDLADALRVFFADFDRIDQATAPLRASALPGPVPADQRHFGDYELLEEIGRGGMGVVYKARQVSLNRIVALKRIRAGQLASPEEVARFRREAKAAAGLDHLNIVPIYDIGEHQGQHYFTMKYFEGGNLAGQAERYRADAKGTAKLMVQVAQAVHHAHQRGILHRDLKPSNILLDGDGQPHVGDFGLAQPLEREGKLTQSGAIVGTPEYMAPEQARGEKGLTTAADVYGLGAILYFLLTGRPPFQGDYNWETLKQVVEEEPVSPRSVNASVKLDLQTICLKCLKKEPKKRYGSAEALGEDLERWLKHKPIRARAAMAGERAWKWAKRHPAGAALYLVCLLSLAAFLGGVIFHRSEVTKKVDVSKAFEDERNRVLTQYLLGTIRGDEGPIGSSERDALYELASLTDDDVRLACLSAALDKEDVAQQLRRRPEMVARAVVGLDTERRKACLRELHARFPAEGEFRNSYSETLQASALLAVELGSSKQEVLLDAALARVLMMLEPRSLSQAYHHAQAKQLVGQMDRRHANSLVQILHDAYLLRDPNDYGKPWRPDLVGEILELVVDKLDTYALDLLLSKLHWFRVDNRQSDLSNRQQLKFVKQLLQAASPGQRLSATAELQQNGRFTSSHLFQETWSFLTAFHQKVDETQKPESFPNHALRIAKARNYLYLPPGVVYHLNAKGVEEIAQAIDGTMTKPKGVVQPRELAASLIALAPRLSPADARRAVKSILAPDFLKPTNLSDQDRMPWVPALEALARRLGSKESAGIAEDLLGRLRPNLGAPHAEYVIHHLKAVAPHVQDGDLARPLARAVLSRVKNAAPMRDRDQLGRIASLSQFGPLPHLNAPAPQVNGLLPHVAMLIWEFSGNPDLNRNRELLAECGSMWLVHLPPQEQATLASEYLGVVREENRKPLEFAGLKGSQPFLSRIASIIANHGTPEQKAELGRVADSWAKKFANAEKSFALLPFLDDQSANRLLREIVKDPAFWGRTGEIGEVVKQSTTLEPKLDAESRTILLEKFLLFGSYGQQAEDDVKRRDTLIGFLLKSIESSGVKRVLQLVLPNWKVWRSAHVSGSILQIALAGLTPEDRREMAPIVVAALPALTDPARPLNASAAETLALVIGAVSPEEASDATQACLAWMSSYAPPTRCLREYKVVQVLAGRLEKNPQQELKEKAVRLIASILAENREAPIHDANGRESKEQLLKEVLSEQDRLDEIAVGNVLAYLVAGIQHTNFQEKDMGKKWLPLVARCTSTDALKTVTAFRSWYPSRDPQYGTTVEQKKERQAVLNALVNRLEVDQVRRLAQDCLEQKPSNGFREVDSYILAMLLPRLDKTEVENMIRPTVQKIAGRIGKGQSDYPMDRLFEVLIRHLEEAEAMKLCETAVRYIEQTVNHHPWEPVRTGIRLHSSDLHAATERLDKDKTHELARKMGHRIVHNIYLGNWEKGLPLVAERMDLPGIVDVLKNPFCFGPMQQVLLEELSKRADQKFANVWQFVEWAQANHPTLDLRTPLVTP